jgi:hypothetical protein
MVAGMYQPIQASKEEQDRLEKDLRALRFTDSIKSDIRNATAEFFGLDTPAKDTKGKLDLTLVSPYLIEEVARVREYGTNKYGDSENWRKVEKKEYVKAVWRHLLKIAMGQVFDEESGLKHWSHIACGVNFIIEMEKDLCEKSSN